MKSDSQFREPTSIERALIDRLLEAEFPGKRELVSMLGYVRVRTIDDDGGLQLRSTSEGRAPVIKMVPVEAEAKDKDGIIVHVLLHVVDGRPVELEIYKENGTTVMELPSPSDLELIVLPPVPDKGWSRLG